LPDLVDPDCAAAVASFLDHAAANAGGQPVRAECSVLVEGSTPRHVDLVAQGLMDLPAGGRVIVTAHDVTGWAEREAQLKKELGCDQMTGIGNRASLMVRLEHAVRIAPPSGPRPAFVVLDLDSFKLLNDSFGHQVGDQVIIWVAQQLSSQVGREGSAFRIGGDEFVVLLDQVTEPTAAAAAEALLACIKGPVEFGGQELTLSATAGVAMIGDNQRVESVAAHADMALYRAKAAGRGSVELYTDDLRDWSVARKTQVEKLSDKLARLQKENRVLSEAATIDCRTNLANTASFDADHGQLHAGFERSHDPYSLLIVDIDHFHDYNSRYGYLEGNKSLRAVADAITGALREGDRAYRWGGEEFAVLLPNTALAGAVPVAERIRSAVEGLRIAHIDNLGCVVTVTVGAVAASRDHDGPEGVFECANSLLLKGKEGGRNRVMVG
jgi:diguanylate cyclase (GGDEF)-like protein